MVGAGTAFIVSNVPLKYICIPFTVVPRHNSLKSHTLRSRLLGKASLANAVLE